MTEETKDYCRLGKPFKVVRRQIGFDVRRQGLDWAVVDCVGFEVAQVDDEDIATAAAEAMNAAADLDGKNLEIRKSGKEI